MAKPFLPRRKIALFAKRLLFVSYFFLLIYFFNSLHKYLNSVSTEERIVEAPIQRRSALSSHGVAAAPVDDAAKDKNAAPDRKSAKSAPSAKSVPAAIAVPSSSSPPPSRRRVILFWTRFFSSQNFHFGLGQQPFIERCEQSNCEATADRERALEADALVFHGPNIGRGGRRDSFVKGLDFPASKPPGQRWVYYMLESPYHSGVSTSLLSNAFNLTMTYRKDSDLRIPYGMTRRRATQDSGPRIDYAKGKTKLVAWFVSNCNTRSRREKYVEKLRKFVHVDVYGSCGELRCAKYEDDPCFENLSKNYKFYLSFENSLCRDYTTEKLWRVLKTTTTVPVVLGGADYVDETPPNSVIDAMKFSPESLAKYLKKLDADDALYNSFHEWRREYEVVHDVAGFCKLCEALQDSTTPPKWYEKFEDHWSISKDCHPEVITWA